MKGLLFGLSLGILTFGKSQDNSFIYYSTSEGSSGRDIYHMREDGREKRKLTRKMGQGHYPHYNSAKISPDGRTIVFQADTDGHDRYTIWTMNTDGGDAKKITQKEGLYPCWSPDGKTILFTGRRNGIWEILSVPSVGGNETMLSNNHSSGKRPGWGATITYHPNGSKIVYAYVRENILYEMDMKTYEVARLQKFKHKGTRPEFSPDGSSIAVNQKVDNRYDLVLISPNGDYLKTLAEIVVSYSPPAWSADGEQIIFTGMVNGNQELFKLDLATGKETQLTNNSFFDAMPTWGK